MYTFLHYSIQVYIILFNTNVCLLFSWGPFNELWWWVHFVVSPSTSMYSLAQIIITYRRPKKKMMSPIWPFYGLHKRKQKKQCPLTPSLPVWLPVPLQSRQGTRCCHWVRHFTPQMSLKCKEITSVACQSLKETNHIVIINCFSVLFPFYFECRSSEWSFHRKMACLAGKIPVQIHGSECLYSLPELWIVMEPFW